MTSRIDSPTPLGASVPASRLRAFAALTGLTSLAIFAQPVIAGQFVSQGGKDSWITTHGVVADAAWVLALITAGYAAVTLRAAYPRLVLWAGALFVLTLAQTGIGHLITDHGQDGWIGVHVPLAFVIFGLTGWLSFKAATLRRSVPSPG